MYPGHPDIGALAKGDLVGGLEGLEVFIGLEESREREGVDEADEEDVFEAEGALARHYGGVVAAVAAVACFWLVMRVMVFSWKLVHRW